MFKIIVAVDEKGGIGKNNTIPWSIKEDMLHFKKTTTNSVIVMGSNTFLSIGGQALPNRINIVISNDDNLTIPKGVLKYSSIVDVINNYRFSKKDIYFIGGERIFEEALPFVDEIIISKIRGDYECDKYFNCDISDWSITEDIVISNDLNIIKYSKPMQVISSVGDSNKDVIKNIMSLYKIKEFDLDCTYSTGSFWKGLPTPKIKSDLMPKDNSIIQADSGNLPFEDESMYNIMFDPPFVITGPGNYHENKDGSSIISKRFEGYANFQELKEHYHRTLKETYRLLKEDGLLVFKCQDTVSGGKQHFTHSMILEMAREIGFQGRDMFILLAKNRLNAFNGQKWKKQEHARKYHSYFVILKKCKERVNYKF